MVCAPASLRRGLLLLAAHEWSAAVVRSEPDVPAATTPAPEPPFVQDFEPASCALGYNCTDGGMKIYRGMCVQAKNPGAGRACWDVCNPNHAPAAYNISEVDNPVLLASTTGLIQSVRANLNPIVQCPNLLGGDACKPGETCSAEFHAAFGVPMGRGMCVLDDTQARDRACWDMCDSRKSPAEYTMGTASGTESKVAEVRGSSACPGLQWWQILLIGLVILLVVACLAGVGYVVMFGMARGKKQEQKQRRFEAEPRDYQEDFPDMQSGQIMEAGSMDTGLYGDDHHDQPYQNQMQQGDSGGVEDMMAPPPSPPRHGQSRELLLEESYGPPPQEPPRGYYAEQGPMSPPEQQFQRHPQQQQQYAPEQPYQQHPQQQQQYAPEQPFQHHPQQQQQYAPEQLQEPVEAPFYPGGGHGGSAGVSACQSASSMGTASGLRIPGLEEPNLLGHLGQMMHQQQAGTADAFHTQVPQSPSLIPSSTQPLGFNFAPGQQAQLQQPAMPSFHTQLPPMYGQQTPTSSVHLRPFTQLQRR